MSNKLSSTDCALTRLGQRLEIVLCHVTRQPDAVEAAVEHHDVRTAGFSLGGRTRGRAAGRESAPFTRFARLSTGLGDLHIHIDVELGRHLPATEDAKRLEFALRDPQRPVHCTASKQKPCHTVRS